MAQITSKSVRDAIALMGEAGEVTIEVADRAEEATVRVAAFMAGRGSSVKYGTRAKALAGGRKTITIYRKQ